MICLFGFRYLASGVSFQTLHFEFRVAACTATKIVYDVCEAIWRHLKEKCIPELKKKDWLDIAEGFNENKDFPNCLGIFILSFLK